MMIRKARGQNLRAREKEAKEYNVAIRVSLLCLYFLYTS